MSHNKFILIFVLYLNLFSLSAGCKTINASSPSGNFTVRISIGNEISYSTYSGKDLLFKECSAGMELNTGIIGHNPKLIRLKRRTVVEKVYPQVPFKHRIVKNEYNSLLLFFKGNYGIEFRVFNNGFAYRFSSSIKRRVQVKDEKLILRFPSNYTAYISKTSSFKTSYENPYSIISTSECKKENTMTYLPVLFEDNKGYKILMSESDLKDYPAMFLQGIDVNTIAAKFPKYPISFGEDGDRSVKILKEADFIAETTGERTYPWRFFVISKKDSDIVDNNMEHNLASSCKLKDCSWITPGQVSWDWWNHRRLYGVDFRAGINDDTYKYYIDFASKFHIPYILIDEGWAKKTDDPFHSISDIHLQDLVAYGRQKHVKIILWLPWLTVERNFSLFNTYAKWGIAGIKIDFMDRSDQWMVDFYERVAKAAADNHLIVDFHGSFKPAGLERCYPNVLSYEGVRGMEQGRGCEPKNSIYLPFIRNAVGPMDFTPGSMFSAQPEDNYSTPSNAMGSGTRTYQMALYIIFESGLQMLADNPVLYYRENDCTRFITSVPVIWDDTKILAAKVGSYIVVAKRRGSRWFVGAITGDKPQQFDIQLNFLDASHKYHLTYFKDGINADQQAMDYRKGEEDVDNSTHIRMNLVRNGGWCGVIQ